MLEAGTHGDVWQCARFVRRMAGSSVLEVFLP